MVKLYDILQLRWIVFAFFMAFAFLLFNGCNQRDNHLDIDRGKMLDSIEAQMFQQPESLDSLLEEVDTININPFEQARMRTIRALRHFNNEEYEKSIKELEQSETFFLKKGDDYHRNINKLIKAFIFEYLNLDNEAANLYIQCKDFFNRNHSNKFKFYASLGLFRLSEQLNLNKKELFEPLKIAVDQFNDPNYYGLLYGTMGVLEKNDSLKIIYYDQAKSEFKSLKRWSRVYAIEINTMYVKIRQDPSDDTQLYYDNFNNKTYNYIPTIKQIMRYKYGQAYLYAKQGKNKQSIEVANKVLDEACEFKITNVESDCVEMLAYLYKRVSDFKNAHIMLERYNYMRERNKETLQQNRLLALGAHYRYSELEREKLELKVQNQLAYLIIGVICLISTILIFTSWFLVKKSRYKQEILRLKNRKIEDHISYLLESLKNKENSNEILINQIEDLKVQHMDSIKIAEFILAIDQKQFKTWNEFETGFRGLHPGWIEKLQNQVPELSTIDLRYCMCIYFNLNNSMIEDLIHVGNDAIKSAKKRLRKKLLLNDAKEIYAFLNDFENN